VSVRLHPPDPPACPEAIDAVLQADWVVIGPGSWFTSVMLTLLVPQLRDALLATKARRALVLNLVEQAGETEGLSPVDHLEVLNAHAPDLRMDVVIADHSHSDSNGALERVAHELGARLVTADVAASTGSDQHESARLSEALRGCLRPAVR
ncbi:MAG TPA: 2-phospho-L-lactate transferase CofD family protein, partial [Aeromicrobium sp.]|nr:2-phospho-L-lactate transferase CofD family protein [Aeromicrobium sp.]